MKWLILLGLLIILVIIIAARYRRQIQMAIYVLRMFRKMQAGKSDERQIEPKESAKDVSLIRCGKCGTWIPQDKALSLRSGIFFCSTNCLENTKAETRPLGRV